MPSSSIVTYGDMPNEVLMFKKSGMSIAWAMPVRKYKRRIIWYCCK